MASYKSMYNKSKSNRNSAYREDQNRFYEQEKINEQRKQQRLIDEEYNRKLEKEQKRGGLDRVFDVASTLGFMTNGLIQDGMSGMVEGAKAGLDGFMPGNKEYGKEYSAKGTLNKVTGGKWDEWNGDIDSAGKAIDALKQGEVGKFATAFGKGLVEFGGEVLTDPTTYLGGAGIAKSLAKGSGTKRIGGEVAELISEGAIKNAGKAKGLDVTSKEAVRYAKEANKLLGNLSSTGDVTFAGKQIKGSGDVLRKVGDKTIAPYFNSLSDSVKDSGILKPFSNKQKLYNALQTDMTEYVGAMKMKDMNVAQKLSRNSYVGKQLKQANDFLNNNKVSDKETQQAMVAFLENPKNYGVSTQYLTTGEAGVATIKGFVEEQTGKTFDELTNNHTKRVWDEITTSEKPYERMGTPKNKFEEYTFKKAIDPENQYSTYDEAYVNFLETQYVKIKQTKQPKPPIKNTTSGTALEMMDKPLTDMDIQTGMFVNTNNVKKYQTLLNNNKAMAKIVGMNDNKKVEWLNRVLFDGKPVINLDNMLFDKKGRLKENVKVEGKLNGVLNLIKSGADESDIFNALDGLVGTVDKNFIDIALNEEELTSFLTNGILNRELPIGKQVRLYDANTRELVGDNLSGMLNKRTSPLADEMRLNKQAKLSSIQEVVDGTRLASNTPVAENLTMSKQEVLNRLGNDFVINSDGNILDTTTGELFKYDEMVSKFMELDMKSAYIQDMKDMSYDPFTRETIGGFAESAQPMTELDHYLNIQVKEQTLNSSVNDYLRSLYDDAINNDYVIKNGELYIKKVDYGLKFDDPSLSNEVKQALDFVFTEFKRMGANERKMGDLRTMINNYVPHILNKEMLKNPQILEKIKTKNPELYRQIFASTGDKWNRFGTARSESLEKSVEKILKERYTAQGLDTSGITGKTIAEVNEALRPMLKEYGFDGDFFINEIYDAYVQRMVTHGEVTYSDKIIDETLEKFGKFVTQGEVKPNKTYYLNQRTLKSIFKGKDETKQFEILHSMGIDFDRVYNKMMLEVKGSELDVLYNVVKKHAPETNLTAFELPESIAHYAQNKGYTQQLEDSNAFLKAYDKFTNIWKQSATVINPGFHIRNKFSNTFQNYLAIGNDVFNPKVRNDVKGILSGAEGVIQTNAGEITFQEIRDQLVARDIVNFQNFNVEGQAITSKTLFGEELKGSGGIFEAIGRKLNANNPTAFNKIDPTDTGNFLLYHAGRTFGGKIEDFDRVLNFVSSVKNGMDFADAQVMVDKFLFDYSDLTSFESNFMKRAIPFYTWIRKNAPLQMEMLLEKPWLYGGIADVHRMSTENADTTHLPEYMQDWIKLPVNFFGKDSYLNPSMPYQDLGNVTMSPKDVVGMLNPAIKMPLELGMNYNTFFESPIYDEDDTQAEASAKQKKYIANTLGGAWNTIGKGLSALTSGDAEKILTSTGSLATGVKVGLHDTDKAKEDAIYRIIRDLEEEWENDKSKGKFNQSFEEYKQTKLKKYGYIK